jgi:hypothetical protein
MTSEDSVETALRSAEPDRALRRLVQNLAREGSTKPAIYEFLEKSLVRLRSRPGFREGDEEVILDIMDALTGWCHPSAELLPENPAR